MTVPPNDMHDDERETAALLGQLKVTPSAAARERAFAVLQREFSAQHAPAPRRTGRWAVAAGIVVALLAGVVWRGTQNQPMVARVEAVDGAVIAREAGWLGGDESLAVESSVSAGSKLRAGPQAGVLLRLSPDLTVRLAANTNVRLASANVLELSTGEVFIDAMPGAHAPLRVVTPFGEVTHLGTQYQVRATAHEVEVAVREGRAQLTAGTLSVVAEAGQWLRHRDSGAAPESGTIAPDDRRFEWIGTLPTDFELEGATLAAFLAWFQRETGLAAIYSDGVDARQSAQVQLKGSIDGLAPIEALSYVLETADLAWHREGPKVIIEKRLDGTG